MNDEIKTLIESLCKEIEKLGSQIDRLEVLNERLFVEKRWDDEKKIYISEYQMRVRKNTTPVEGFKAGLSVGEMYFLVGKKAS